MAMFLAAAILVFSRVCSGYDYGSYVSVDSFEGELSAVVAANSSATTPLMVPLTLIPDAAAKGAVCLDGTAPAYHFDPGSGSGANSWLINLEGGGWCNNFRNCVYRKKTPRGSSNYMEKKIQFTGIMSNKAEENPDFFNWNRVKLRYCDGASFTGNGTNEVRQLEFQGQKIWVAAMEELMSKGLRSANQALLSGCSAGGLASILHCDQFRELFSNSTKVKCLSDAGFFLDATDIAGGKTLRKMYEGVVTLQGAQKNLPKTCTSHLDPTSCFFPQNIVSDLKTPLFILNAAYDVWQVISSLAPKTADPRGEWDACRKSIVNCNTSQIQVLQEFRNEMYDALKDFIAKSENGLFLNSCYSHCQSELQDSWFSDKSPQIQNKKIATAVGDWYFDRKEDVKAVDCPYPCDKTCHNVVFKVAGIADLPI